MVESWLIGTWNTRWKTKDGTSIAVKDLTDSHIRNILRRLSTMSIEGSYLDEYDEWRTEDNSINGRPVSDWIAILEYEQSRRITLPPIYLIPN